MQTLGARFAHGLVTLEEAADLGCRACASPGGGCQFLGTAATSQVVAEALGLTVPHAALAPSGQPIWLDVARRTARRGARPVGERAHARRRAHDRGDRERDARARGVRRLDEPAHPHPGDRPRGRPARGPPSTDWRRVNRAVPRLVDALPNGPRNHPTVRVFLAGGVPEVMLHLRRLGLLNARRADGRWAARWDDVLDEWEASERRARLRAAARARPTGSIPTTSICPPDRAREKGMTSTVCFPQRQPRPGRQRHQGDRDRPPLARRRRRLPADRPGARLHERAAPRSRRSRAPTATRSSPAT